MTRCSESSTALARYHSPDVFEWSGRRSHDNKSFTMGRPVDRTSSRLANITRAVLEAAVQRGVDPAELARVAGLEEELTGDRTARIAPALDEAVWTTAAALSREPGFGLSFAQAVSPSTYGLLGFLVTTAPTLGEALRLLRDYYPLASTDGLFRLEHSSTETAIIVTPRGSRTWPPLLAEAVLAIYLRLVRWPMGADFQPLRVWFRHPRAQAAQAVFDHFKAPIHFEQPDNALFVPSEILDRPMPKGRPDVCQFLEAQAKKELPHTRPDDPVLEKLESLLSSSMPQGRMSLSAAARRMKMSARSLQRELATRNTSFRDVTQRVALEHARTLMLSTPLRVEEVAERVGFSSAKALRRAFVRWAGAPPTRYRRA
jgi:AraC-like DNA-binding protein